jgi:hypothetical protein
MPERRPEYAVVPRKPLSGKLQLLRNKLERRLEVILRAVPLGERLSVGSQRRKDGSIFVKRPRMHIHELSKESKDTQRLSTLAVSTLVHRVGT